MLSREENDLLTKVGPGTPMGELLRQYWLPVLLSTELPARDGPPLRVRLLGENLITFRDSAGNIGMLGNNCPHRGASLFFGRNEEQGLRCVYHGWKFDITGACVGMPNEPPESNFKHKIHHAAYPCRELNGIVWTYMGPRKDPPAMPEIGWALLPPEQRMVSKNHRECNFMQGLEGDIDSSHSSFLHSRLTPEGNVNESAGAHRRDKHPAFEVVDTEYGVMIGVRHIPFENQDQAYWRIAQYLFPIFTMFPPTGVQAQAVPGHIWVPLDDENTMVWTMYWNPSGSMDADPFGGRRSGSDRQGAFGHDPGYLPATSGWMGAWRNAANSSNDYMLDYEAQRTVRFFGVPTVPLQDQAVTESMGPVRDRTKEHLGTTDAGIIRARRRLIEAAKALRDAGVTPPGAEDPSVYRGVRSASGLLPLEASWLEATAGWVKAPLGVPVTSA